MAWHVACLTGACVPVENVDSAAVGMWSVKFIDLKVPAGAVQIFL